MTQGPTKRSADNAPTNKPARKLKRLSPDQMTQLEYRKKVEACAASSNAVEALKIFDEMTTQAIPVQPYLYQMILNICGATTTDENIEEAAFRVFDHMKASLVQTEKSTKKYPIDESSYSALIKLCSKQLHTERALGLIAELESHNVGPKLRTFAPLLVAFASLKDLTQAWWVYEKLIEHNIEATEAEYVALFEVCTAVRNEEMFYKVLNIFLEEILVPSRSTWAVLKNWFLNETQPWQCSVGVVDDTGICSITGSKLESIELQDDKAKALLAKVENLVCDSDKRKEQWASFKEWLEVHGPFDVVIDAANVGYFNQNFEGGGFNYKQIATVLQAYQKKGLKPLIVLHKNRTRDEQVPEHHRAMVQQWKDDGIMFNCLPGNNDDWYWLYAAVKLGGRTLVVSNDEMRDHHFQMIHNKDFVRWKERHLVHYKVRGGQMLELSEPSVYSKQSQHLASSWHFPSPDNEEWLVIHRP